MKSNPVGVGMFEYGEVNIPQDLDQLRLVAAQEPESNHFMVISIRLFYQLTKKAMAYDAMSAAIKKSQKTDPSNEGKEECNDDGSDQPAAEA